ncbi:hypothetical protein H4N58_17475 [Mumia sp. ZJ1417]|uniref:hypothetical protein n=1 Tax=Mumia sp. ZJ1417 TaxID=2708082 RepID=UPI0014239B1B|nr:hypothetical protein [Mumia sp. ZJ1417]QMW65923.1 hypothetical protein H4N58_17475 [Mumia sp. ZJ1417]
MDTRLCIVVRSTSASPAMGDLVASLDRQSLPVSSFEVLFLESGLDDRTRERLRRLGDRRPHVQVLSEEQAAALDLTCDVVLPLRDTDVLLPDALARVGSAAADADAVALSRVDEPGGGPDAGDADLLRDAPAVAFRADFLRSAGLSPFDPDIVAKAAVALPRVRALADPALRATRPWRNEPTIKATSVGWADETLTLVVEDAVALEAAGPPFSQVRLVARHARTGRQVRLESAATLEEDGATVRISLTSGFAPSSADSPLSSESGPWHLRVEFDGPRRLISLPVRSTEPTSAVLGDVVVALVDHPRGLAVIVGEARGPVVRPDAAAAAFDEGSVGTLMSLPLIGIHAVAPSARGELVIDPIAVPAEIVESDGRTVLTALVSGMPGRYTLSTTFGPTATPLGYDLVIDGMGRMSLAPTAPAKPKPKKRTPRAPATSKDESAPATTSFLQRARRRAPEPVVRALADVRPLRAAYQRLTRR